MLRSSLQDDKHSEAGQPALRKRSAGTFTARDLATTGTGAPGLPDQGATGGTSWTVSPDGRSQTG